MYKKKVYKVLAGEHAGRVGNLVSVPWIGNLWNRYMQLNVPADETEINRQYGTYPNWCKLLIEDMRQGVGPRSWIRVWRSQAEEMR